MANAHAQMIEPASAPCNHDAFGVVREFLTKVGDKWSVVLLVTLARMPTKRARFSELQRKLDPTSQRVLTTTLPSLERDGFDPREVLAEVPPRVEYELTGRGLDLLEPLEVQRITASHPAIARSRELFDEHAR